MRLMVLSDLVFTKCGRENLREKQKIVAVKTKHKTRKEKKSNTDDYIAQRRLENYLC